MIKCVILASGFGTRLYPLTSNKAKALLAYRGKPIISHILNRIPGDMEVFVTTNRKSEIDFHEWSKTLDRPVAFCVEPVFTEEQSLGAVGSLNYFVTTRNITHDLLVTAGDNYFESSLTEFISSYDGQTTLVDVYDIGNKSKSSQFGVVKLDGCRVTRFEEKPAETESSTIATACYIFPTRIFSLLSEFCYGGKKDNLGSFIAYLVAKDVVHAYTFTELWFDVGSSPDYLLV